MIKMLGVVRNLLHRKKDSRVSVMATIERPAPVRSMVMRISTWRGLSSDPLVSLGGGCIMYGTGDDFSWINKNNEVENANARISIVAPIEV